MLIIFDLDDTLIDTSGSIIPFKLKSAIQKLEKHMPNFPAEKASKMLRDMNQYAYSFPEMFKEFLEINEFDQKLFDSINQELIDEKEFYYEVALTPNALEVILEISRKHTLALVSYGKKEFQLEKMKKAGIDTSLFSRIVICENENKKSYYQALVEELEFSPLQVLVCGDRVKRDLSPAKALGYKTVHMRWGRGLGQIQDKCDVDFTIASLEGLKPIVMQFESF